MDVTEEQIKKDLNTTRACNQRDTWLKKIKEDSIMKLPNEFRAKERRYNPYFDNYDLRDD